MQPQRAVATRTSRGNFCDVFTATMFVHFTCAKIYGARRCIQPPGISVPLLNSSCVPTVKSGKPFDCSNRLRRCDLQGDPFLGVPAFSTRTPADGPASVEDG